MSHHGPIGKTRLPTVHLGTLTHRLISDDASRWHAHLPLMTPDGVGRASPCVRGFEDSVECYRVGDHHVVGGVHRFGVGAHSGAMNSRPAGTTTWSSRMTRYQLGMLVHAGGPDGSMSAK